MTYNVRNIVIALVLAAVAAILVIMYTGSVKKQADTSQTTVKVLVATTDIAAGSHNSVTLKVPDSVVPKITLTMHSGELWMVLRPASGSQDGQTFLATPNTVIFDGLTKKQIINAITVGG